jgi:predicted double-glycine peptidase
MLIRRELAALTLVLGAASCANQPTATIDGFAQRTSANSFEVRNRKLPEPAKALVLPVAQSRQVEGPSCGAHALAMVANYLRGSSAPTADVTFRDHPPKSESGYSMAELMELARRQGLLVSAVRLSDQNLIAELERGRPIIIPVKMPSIYVQQRSLPFGDAPVVGFARNALIYRAGKVSEWTRLGMVDHYLVVAGYDGATFVVVDPVMGYRTISSAKLDRYRKPFQDAALVLSAAPEPERPPQQLQPRKKKKALARPAPGA